MKPDEGSPQWPDDLLYLPVDPSDKSPDFSAPEFVDTWDSDGTSCVTHDDLHERAWGIVDVDADGWRLLIIDLDIYKADDPDEDLTQEDADRLLNGLTKAPDTRVHDTQSGGKHVFYWIREEELGRGDDPDEDDERLPVKLAKGIDDKLNGYVLSTHCDGYEAVSDIDPAVISPEQIPDEWIEDNADKSKEEVEWTKHERGKDVPFTVHDVLHGNHPEEERFEHPFHGSSTGTNFMIDEGGESFRCWRHGITGGPLHLLGMKEGIIECGEWDGILGDTKWRRLNEAAEDRGLQEAPKPSLEEHGEILERADVQHEYDSIEEAPFDPSKDYVLDKPPREGGSYWTMKNFVATSDPFVILTPTHDICKTHAETVGDMLPRQEAVVHLVGSNQACDHEGSGQCPLLPGQDEIGVLDSEIEDVLYREDVVTADDCPDGFCKSTFIKRAAGAAHAVVTVPELFHKVCEERDNLNQNRLFIDEEQALSNFWPSSITLTDLVLEWNTDGSPSIEQRNRSIGEIQNVMEDMMEDIREDQEERAEENDGNFRRTSDELLVEESLRALDEMAEAVAPNNLVSEMKERDMAVRLGNAVDVAEELLNDIELPGTNATAANLIPRIRERCEEYYWRDDNADISGVLTAMAFPVEESFRFHFKRTDEGRYTLRFIGDKEREPFYADELRSFSQIGVVASKEGERFLDELDRGEIRNIEIQSFKYEEDFIVLTIGAEDDEDGLEPTRQQRNRVKRIAAELNASNHPQLVVSGTKERAANIAANYTEGRANVIGSPTDPEKDMAEGWMMGSTEVFYQNSTISRGIDAPFFDVTAVAEPGFAVPYWEAKAEHYRGIDPDIYRDAALREGLFKGRELTNCAFRMSPVYYLEDEMGTKVIVIAKDDADGDTNGLKHLDSRQLGPFENEERVANIVRTLTLSGSVSEETQRLSDEVGGGKEAIKTLISGEIHTDGYEKRPEWHLGEVEQVIENDIADPGFLNHVLSALRERPMTIKEVSETIGCEHRKAKQNLTILSKKGLIEKEEESNGRGRPKKLWKALAS